MYDDVDLPLSGLLPQLVSEKAASFNPSLLVNDEEVGGRGQVTKQMLGGPHMSLGRLGHSPCQLIHGVEDVIPGNLCELHGGSYDSSPVG